MRVILKVKRINPIYTSFARELRKNQTDVEKKLWFKLRNRQVLGVKFRRQHKLYDYIVDFVSLEKKLILELDGGQHNEEMIKNSDKKRSLLFEKEGYRVLRFWNNEIIEDIESVLEKIHNTLTQPSP